MWTVMLLRQTNALLPGKVIVQAEMYSRVLVPVLVRTVLMQVLCGSFLLSAFLKENMQRQKHLCHIITCWVRSCNT